MPTISELRESLQREKIEGRERPWGYVWLQRGPSIYLTWLIAKTPLQPNTITGASILAGIIGMLLLSSGRWGIMLLGIFFFYLNLILDRVDGELARYRQTFSLKGIYGDEINHLIIPALFFAGLTCGIADLSASFPTHILVGLGGITASAMILIRVTHNIPYQIYLKKYIKYEVLHPMPTEAPLPAEDLRSQYAVIYPVVRIVHQFQDFLIILFVFATSLITERLWSISYFLFPITSWMLLGYAVFLSLIVLENFWKSMRSIEARMQELEKTERG
jgi:phosphatidylglycerophosphate synthase